jgi:PAS domain S-box-containing protein
MEKSDNKTFQAVPIGTLLTRLKDGVFIHVNKNYADIHGYTVEEMIGSSVFELNTWAIIDERKLVIGILMEKGSFPETTIKARHKDGSVKDCLLSADLITIDGEKYALAVIREII